VTLSRLSIPSLVLPELKLISPFSGRSARSHFDEACRIEVAIAR